MSHWNSHRAVRSGSDLSFGERAADRMRNSFGSWTFIGCTCLFLAVWMAYNRGHGFDPYPWILLNLILSCFAAMQGAIILLAAKRADKISSEVALHTQTNTDQLLDMNQRQLAILEELRQVRAQLERLDSDGQAQS